MESSFPIAEAASVNFLASLFPSKQSKSMNTIADVVVDMFDVVVDTFDVAVDIFDVVDTFDAAMIGKRWREGEVENPFPFCRSDANLVHFLFGHASQGTWRLSGFAS